MQYTIIKESIFVNTFLCQSQKKRTLAPSTEHAHDKKYMSRPYSIDYDELCSARTSPK